MYASKWTGAAALCAGLLFGGAAQAADDGWYLVGFGGEASTKNVSQGEVDQNLIDFFGSGGLTVVDAVSSLDDSDTGFGLAVGYQVNENFATELAYVDLGETSYTAEGTVTDGLADYPASFGLSQTAAGPVFSLLGIVPIGERFSVFARAGLALMSVDADVDVTIDGVADSAKASTDRSNGVYGLGGEFSMSNRFGIRLEWNRYASVGSEDITGDTDIDLISIGLRYNFD
jgi:OOP family OmpA-OmpF porin